MRRYRVVFASALLVVAAAAYISQRFVVAQTVAPEPKSAQIEAHQLYALPGDQVLELLKAAFGDDLKLSLDQNRKLVIARGSKEKLRALAEVIRTLHRASNQPPAGFNQPVQPLPVPSPGQPQSPFRAEPYRRPQQGSFRAEPYRSTPAPSQPYTNPNPPPIQYGQPIHPTAPGTPPLRPSYVTPAPGYSYPPPSTQYHYPSYYPNTKIEHDAKNPAAAEATKKYNALERRVLELAAKYRKVDSSEDEENLRLEIIELTEQQFALRQEVRKSEVERLRKRLEDVENKLKRREELKEKVVAKRVADLLDESGELRWEPLGATPGVTQRLQRKVVTRIEKLPDGTERKVPTVVYETVQVATPTSVLPGPTQVSTSFASPTLPWPANRGESAPSPAGAANTPSSSTIAATSAVADPPPGRSPPSPAEATIYLHNAKDQLQRAEKLFERGLVPESQLEAAKQRTKAAERMLQQLQQQHRAKAEILNLDRKKVMLDLQAAVESLQELEKVAKSSPTAVSESELRNKQLAVDKLQLEVKKLQTLADLHTKSGVTDEATSDAAEENPDDTDN